MSKPGMVIGFIGLGDQGAPMAHRIAAAGWPLQIWARRPESLTPFADTAALTADSPRALARAVDILCFCTFGEGDLKELLFRDPDGAANGLGAGKTVVIHNTVSPTACREIAARLGPIGVEVLDAPVAGGREKAFASQLAVMVGGEKSVFERVCPVFVSYGHPVVYLGPLGSGQVAKIINNALMICNMELADAAFAIAGQLGLSPQAIQDVLTCSSAASVSMNLLVAHDRGIRRADESGPRIIAKDIALFIALCTAHGVDMRDLGRVGAAASDRAQDLLRIHATRE